MEHWSLKKFNWRCTIPCLIFDPASAVLPTTNPAALVKTNGTNHTFNELDFDTTTDESCYWIFQMDEFYDSGAIQIHVFWKAAATTGSVVWQANLLGRVDTEIWDTALGSASYIQDTVQGTTEYLSKATIDIASTGLNPSDLVILKISRDADGTGGTDNMAGDARLLNVILEFTVRN